MLGERVKWGNSKRIVRHGFLLMLLLWGTVEMGYGQRVYADVETSSSTPLLASIVNSDLAIDGDTTTFSRLNVTVGLLSLVQANQIIYFSNAPSYLLHSPVIVKFGTPGSLLDLLGGLSIQRMNDGTGIAPIYGRTSLLELLNLFGGGTVAVLNIPPTGQQYTGVRLTINTTLGVARTARFYYAFYIIPPIIPQVTLCEGVSGAAVISNFQSGYTYKLYTQQMGGTQIGSDITTNSFLIPDDWEGSYWLEAREGNIYPSARTELKIVRNKISSGAISEDQTICEGEIPMQLNGELPETTMGAAISYQWQKKASGIFSDIEEANTQNYQPPSLYETTTFRRLAISEINGVSCTAVSNEITITVLPLPGKPQLSISDVTN